MGINHTKKKTLLVTGGTGHTGKIFFQELIKHNYQNPIKCIVRIGSNIDFLKEVNLNIDFCYGDLNDIEFLKSSMAGVNFVLNIAGIHFSEDIIKAGNIYFVEWFICVHTTGRYSQYKSAASEYIKIEDKILNKYSNLTILRPTMIYGGSSDKNIWKLINYINKHKFFPIFSSGLNLMQPVHAEDLGNAYFRVLSNKNKTFGKQYNLSGNNEITYISLLKEVSSGLNKKTIFIHFPIWFSVTCVYIYNLIFKSAALISVEQVLRMQENKVFSWKDAYDDFGYSPKNFKDGIKIELDEFKEKHL